MNNKIYIISVAIFLIILSIIAGLQFKWENNVIISIIILFLATIILGYALKSIYQESVFEREEKKKYYKSYLDCLNSMKQQNENSFKDIKDNMDILINYISNSCDVLGNIEKEIKRENEKIKGIDRTLKDIQDNLDDAIDNMSLDNLNKIMKDNKMHIEELNKLLQKEKSNIYKIIEQFILQYQNLTKEDMDLLKQISGEFK
ncbi:hypothetical protein B5F82_05035 [Megamonas hypermegale]|uniref:hypothetical protein n=1 Tax=Megamonas hypermegale TaxID=158847 RepID=UPI000B37F937|nr:hypothetical protein [Megamonas hypermegale]OUO40273.1 hypothetical protein B5F82_05035 [Megamonas hypermegale]